MPILHGKDTSGCFMKFGQQGHKYHYICGNEKSRENAKEKVIAQAIAIGEENKL